MEQQLSNKEIARVFAMYLGCKIVYQQNHSLVFKVSGIVIENIIDENLETPDRLLLLTPLSKITDEHAIEVAQLVPFSSNSPNLKTYKTDYEYCMHIKLTPDSIGFRYREYKISLEKLCLENSTVFQYLVQQSYAVPLFFGINHPCNGKDAITLGVAIDKTAVKAV
jgi:hypothetical protein